MRRWNEHVISMVLAGLTALTPLTAHAQTPLSTSFTYQGELASGGVPVTGEYDVRFRLFDAAAGGTQLGSTLCSDNLSVSNGRFTVSLDFGAAFNGQQRFLEIEVRQDGGLDCSDATGYTALTPRQQLTAAPNAAFSLTATNAFQLNGQPASFFTNAANLTGTLPPAALSGTYASPLTLTNPANLFSGNGAAITNLSATNISTGVLPNARTSGTNLSTANTLVLRDANGNFSAGNITAALNGNATTATTAANAAQLNGQPASFYTNASNINAGTLADAQLSSNIARLNGNQTFTGLLNFTNAGNTFVGSGAGLTNLHGGSISPGTLARSSLNADVQSGVGTVLFNLSLAGSAVTGNQPYSVSVSGSFAYVVNNGSNTLQVFNIGNPAAPTLVGSVATGVEPDGVFVSGSFAYVVNNGSNTLQVFNIGNPAAPTLAGSVATGINPISVAVSGSLAYVVNITSNTLQVFDISNPSAPTLAGSVATGSFPISVAVSGSFAYVANYGSSTLQVFNISNPVAPRLVGTRVTDYRPQSVAVSGSLAFVVNQGWDTLMAFSADNGIGFGTPLAASSLAGVNGSGLTGVNAAQLNGQLASFYTNASNLTTGTLANARTSGTDLSTPSTLVLRDAAGNFSAGTITAVLNGNATTATNATQLDGQAASFYTNASNISTGSLANAHTSGTNLNTPSSLVLRDASGNFAAGTITGALNGNASTATNSTQLNGQAASFYTNASNITTGTLSDLRLSSNVALKNTTNAFTSPGTTTFAGSIVAGSSSPLASPTTRIAAVTGSSQYGLTHTDGTVTVSTYVGGGTGGGWIGTFTNHPFSLFVNNGSPSLTVNTNGSVSVIGALSKGGGSFKIDHPLDPKNKYLYHSFVESPDMMNIYNGVIMTDSRGLAVVDLPDYFEALNRDFRYQLTVMDDSENDFILTKIYREIGAAAPRQFTIKSSQPHTKISWQVTGIRHDAWANKNRIPNSVDKVGSEKGKLLHPDAFETSAEGGISSSTFSTPTADRQKGTK